MMDIKEIQSILPQSYPFLMIDRVVEFNEGKSLTAVKNITANEWAFVEASGTSVFPETLLLEAAAQAAILLNYKRGEKSAQKSKYFLGKTTAEFFRPVVAGDRLLIKAAAGKIMKDGGYINSVITVNDEKVAEVEIIYKKV